MTPARQHACRERRRTDWVDLAFGLFMGTMTGVSGWLWLGTPAWALGVVLIVMGASVDAGAIVAWRSERR